MQISQLEKKKKFYLEKLPDEDSNLDKLNQNQLYCHYTIGQSCPFWGDTLQKECKNKGS